MSFLGAEDPMPDATQNKVFTSSGAKGKKKKTASGTKTPPSLSADANLSMPPSGPAEGRRAAEEFFRATPSISLETEEQILLVRLEGVVNQLVSSVSHAAVTQALAAPSHISALGVLLDTWIQEHSEIVAFDPAAAHHVRLARAREDLLKRAGGTCSTSEAADLLGTTAEAVRKRLQRGTLLSYRTASGEHRLPMAQFSSGETLEGLQEVLQAMHVEDPWMRIQLFLDEDVLGALKDGRVDDAVRAVRTYLPTDEDLSE